ncbi:hypothetical protein SELMODRAFT_417741 [Selaginella moellendorffii]|uniref:RING-type domain-containing protein n=1 Tax=Selaginella moellendorffii TaxID=88036 RepID=D8S3G4_SELML|nr:hypothetical protein SELMODRAFT_417741 [Selaginella moellendorffii]
MEALRLRYGGSHELDIALVFSSLGLTRLPQSLVELESVKCVASPALVASLDRTVFSDGGGGGSADSCVICQNEYVGGDNLSRLPCKHDVHEACGSEWLLNYSKLCPVCKADIATLLFLIDSSSNDEQAVHSTLQRVLSWNIAIAAYARNGQVELAKAVFDESPQRDVSSWNTLAQAYLHRQDFSSAKRAFDGMPSHDVVSLNTMVCGVLLSAYIRNEEPVLAKEFFDKMWKRDQFSWNILLCGFVHCGWLDKAEILLHEKMPMYGIVPMNAILAGYSQLGNLEKVKMLFDALPCGNVVSWFILIACHAHKGESLQTKLVFGKMPQLNMVAWNALGFVCGLTKQLEAAREVFHSMPDPQHYGSVIDLVARSGEVKDAKGMLAWFGLASDVAWRSLLAACRIQLDEESALAAASSQEDHKEKAPYSLLVNILAS